MVIDTQTAGALDELLGTEAMPAQSTRRGVMTRRCVLCSWVSSGSAKVVEQEWAAHYRRYHHAPSSPSPALVMPR